MTMTPLRAPLPPADDGPRGAPDQQLLDRLRDAARAEDQGRRDISDSVGLLRRAGLLEEAGARDPAATARALMRIGGVNLSLGRLWEGHVNALRLIDLYGGPRLARDMRARIAQGAFLGVWGADGEVAVTLAPEGDRLVGTKRFASGLGTVTHAVVTLDSGPEVRLALVPAGDPSRQDAGRWTMTGMRATASGHVDLTGIPVSAITWIGAPGDYLHEPHFVGGVWRIAALQVGAAAGLLDEVAARLRQMGRLEAEAQKTRLMTALTRVWGGMALVERAARRAADPRPDPEEVVTTSIAARLLTEEIGQEAIRVAEQCLGLAHFDAAADSGRMARDLAVYMRQAARDAFLMRAAATAFGRDGRLWEMLS